MILTRFDNMDCAMTQLATSVTEVQNPQATWHQLLHPCVQLQRSSASAIKISTQSASNEFAHFEASSSDDLFRRDLSPAMRRSSRLAPKGEPPEAMVARKTCGHAVLIAESRLEEWYSDPNARIRNRI